MTQREYLLKQRAGAEHSNRPQSVALIDEALRELDARETAELQARLEPIIAQNNELHRQIHEQETLKARDDYRAGRPDSTLRGIKNVGAGVTDSSEVVKAQIDAAFEQYRTWAETNPSVRLSLSGHKRLARYIKQQSGELDIRDPQVWIDCLQRCIDLDLFGEDEIRFLPQEPESEAESVVDVDRISSMNPEGDRQVKQALQHNYIQHEIKPVFDRFLEGRGSELSAAQQQEIIGFVQRHNLNPLNDTTWVKSMITLFPELENETEKAERQERYDRDNLPMDEYKRKYGIRIAAPASRAVVASENRRSTL